MFLSEVEKVTLSKGFLLHLINFQELLWAKLTQNIQLNNQRVKLSPRQRHVTNR